MRREREGQKRKERRRRRQTRARRASSVLCPASTLASSMVARLRKRPAAHAPSVQGVEPRLYRYITYRSQGGQAGWIVQWNGSTWGGFHDTQHEAAKTLQKAMGLPNLSMLPRLHGAPSVQRPASGVSRFKGVYWHKAKRRWTTRSSSRSFASVGEAARATDASRKPAKPSTIVQRLKFMRRIFDAGELPADLEDLESRAKSFQGMCRQEPALEPIGIQLKYGPWRANLIECWKASCVQRPASLSVEQRAASIFEVLVSVAKAVSKEGVPYWSKHAGRGVSRHMGGQMVLLKHLGVLIRQCDESRGLSFQGLKMTLMMMRQAPNGNLHVPSRKGTMRWASCNGSSAHGMCCPASSQMHPPSAQSGATR